jgi:hypothetical protein
MAVRGDTGPASKRRSPGNSVRRIGDSPTPGDRWVTSLRPLIFDSSLVVRGGQRHFAGGVGRVGGEPVAVRSLQQMSLSGTPAVRRRLGLIRCLENTDFAVGVNMQFATEL